MMPPAPARAALPGLALAALTLLGASCRKGPLCYPVRGQLLVGNQPAEGALVVFVPAPDPGGQAPRPSATVGADGSFTLQTYDSQTRTTQTGAPPGAYVVTVLWQPEEAKDPSRERTSADLPDRLQARYADPATSPLRAEVKPGGNDLEPFRLPAAGLKAGKR
jgi:hypothetical protein